MQDELQPTTAGPTSKSKASGTSFVFPKAVPSDPTKEPEVAPETAAVALTLDQQIESLSPPVQTFLKEHLENLVAEIHAGAADSSALIHFLPGELKSCE